MLTRRTVVVSVLVLVIAGFSASRAYAQDGGAATLYRLESGSSFTRGCFGPCLCPIFATEDVRGTYTLAFDHQDPLFTWYRIENVNWVTTIGGTDTRITGSGSYRIGGEVAVQEQVQLKLQIGDEDSQLFDSGLVSGATSFPDINITISVNGMVCFDTVIDIRSQPVPASDITPYNLGSSTYDEGCFPPCRCLLRNWPIGGTFNLVPLNNATTPIRREFAVADVKWRTISPISPPPAPGRIFSGYGWYQIAEVGPTSNNRMVLDLTEAYNGTTSRFDSGVAPGGTDFPRIDTDLAVNGPYCFGKVFFLHAEPAKRERSPRPPPPGEEPRLAMGASDGCNLWSAATCRRFRSDAKPIAATSRRTPKEL